MPKIAPNSPLYAQFRQDFPAQAGEGITSDLNYSDTIVPVIDMTSSAGEGTLPQNLQTARDFATGKLSINSVSSVSIINTPGFWQIDVNYVGFVTSTAGGDNNLFIRDSSGTTKTVWFLNNSTSATGNNESFADEQFVVFLRSGDDLRGKVYNVAGRLNVIYRQIADVNGNLINPLDFTFG